MALETFLKFAKKDLSLLLIAIFNPTFPLICSSKAISLDID